MILYTVEWYFGLTGLFVISQVQNKVGLGIVINQHYCQHKKLTVLTLLGNSADAGQ